MVVVSAAAGSTGSFVAQIAKLKGCRVIGIAGGEKKCTFLIKDLSLDGAIDHRREDVPARLRELCPNGINVYFDNVGGEILDAALGNLAAGARIVVCGAIAGYNDLAHMPPIRNYLNLVLAGATMRGFLVLTFAARFGEAIAQLASWATAGQVRTQVDIMEGLGEGAGGAPASFHGPKHREAAYKDCRCAVTARLVEQQLSCVERGPSHGAVTGTRATVLPPEGR